MSTKSPYKRIIPNTADIFLSSGEQTSPKSVAPIDSGSVLTDQSVREQSKRPSKQKTKILSASSSSASQPPSTDSISVASTISNATATAVQASQTKRPKVSNVKNRNIADIANRPNNQQEKNYFNHTTNFFDSGQQGEKIKSRIFTGIESVADQVIKNNYQTVYSQSSEEKSNLPEKDEAIAYAVGDFSENLKKADNFFQPIPSKQNKSINFSDISTVDLPDTSSRNGSLTRISPTKIKKIETTGPTTWPSATSIHRSRIATSKLPQQRQSIPQTAEKVKKTPPEKSDNQSFLATLELTENIADNTASFPRSELTAKTLPTEIPRQNLGVGNRRSSLVAAAKNSDKLKKESFVQINYQNWFDNFQISLRNIFRGIKIYWTDFGKSLAIGAILIILLISGAVLGGRLWASKEAIEEKSWQALDHLREVKTAFREGDLSKASTNLWAAQENFAASQKDLQAIGGDKLDIFQNIPGLSKLSSRKNIIDLGAALTTAAYELASVSEMITALDNPLQGLVDSQENAFSTGGQSLSSEKKLSLTDFLVVLGERIKKAKSSLLIAEEAANKIKEKDLPSEYQEKIKKVKEVLPLSLATLDKAERFERIFLEIFGHYGPRKYLLLFQNNQEMRATGGFIGSYGLLETNQGQIENLKIEGIYNPDGQLRVSVVPPRPVQKISESWSMHDANWWPDFPKSAQKIAWFYEKTGGPTVDGIIAITPVVLQKMLEITGPIEMPEYQRVITAQNFLTEIQKEVEVDYDKELNRPKQILADLTPKILTKFFANNSPEQLAKMIDILLQALKEKHILIYFNQPELQKIIEEEGWGGRIAQVEQDYLAVINTNINGYKTDGVIKEIIVHQTKIEKDGSVVDTVTITRKHKGGRTDYEWWNQVNADYQRIYVPLGSKLISVEGHTREFNEPRLAYRELGFQVDSEVAREEGSMQIDPATGTRIYEDSGKTVFANWVYVSPQEEVTVTYKYKLPFKVKVSEQENGKYSLLVQKQAGATNSHLVAEIEFPFQWRLLWLVPPEMSLDHYNNKLIYKQRLNEDLFLGAVFESKE